MPTRYGSCQCFSVRKVDVVGEITPPGVYEYDRVGTGAHPTKAKPAHAVTPDADDHT